MLPLAPGRAERYGFEHQRNGALRLFAALNTATGEVLGMTAPRHTSEQFVGFLSDVLASQPERYAIDQSEKRDGTLPLVHVGRQAIVWAGRFRRPPPG